MKKEIRIIGLDLDGTTFTNDKTITQHTKEVIEKATAQGIVVLPCTGRQYSGLPEEFLAMKGVKYAITSNGASIVDLETKEPIYTNYIPYEIAAETMEQLLKENTLVDIYINGRCYIEERLVERFSDFIPTPAIAEYFRKTRIPVNNLANVIRNNHLDAEKFHLLFNDMDLRAELKKEYDQNPHFLATCAVHNNLELNNITADKGTALLALADILDIPHDQTMACGDSFNDEAMLCKAGFSVAMGNADPEMKEICDFVTKTNEEDGVAYAIETFVLS
ncbi:MAG: Cof-type HAD-IIB family hydrolase [Lachnospiraceae bacterium]|nr:Cof-type HAD-IIB family hydrolase [Lachnospiraceae bacterium]